MKREIKFRGKRLDNGEWVKGDLLQYESGEAAILKHFSKHGKECSEMLNRDKVDPATVGQYTGLKDRNGKDIYEGDILEYMTVFGGIYDDAVVFENGFFGIKYEGRFLISVNDLLEEVNVCVIGNIHNQNFKQNDNK